MCNGHQSDYFARRQIKDLVLVFQANFCILIVVKRWRLIVSVSTIYVETLNKIKSNDFEIKVELLTFKVVWFWGQSLWMKPPPYVCMYGIVCIRHRMYGGGKPQ